MAISDVLTPVLLRLLEHRSILPLLKSNAGLRKANIHLFGNADQYGLAKRFKLDCQGLEFDLPVVFNYRKKYEIFKAVNKGPGGYLGRHQRLAKGSIFSWGAKIAGLEGL